MHKLNQKCEEMEEITKEIVAAKQDLQKSKAEAENLNLKHSEAVLDYRSKQLKNFERREQELER